MENTIDEKVEAAYAEALANSVNLTGMESPFQRTNREWATAIGIGTPEDLLKDILEKMKSEDDDVSSQASEDHDQFHKNVKQDKDEYKASLKEMLQNQGKKKKKSSTPTGISLMDLASNIQGTAKELESIDQKQKTKTKKKPKIVEKMTDAAKESLSAKEVSSIEPEKTINSSKSIASEVATSNMLDDTGNDKLTIDPIVKATPLQKEEKTEAPERVKPKKEKKTSPVKKAQKKVNESMLVNKTGDSDELLEQIAEKVDLIYERLSVKDITIGKGENAESFRYDPLAPEGKQVKQITVNGKAGLDASKEGGAVSEYQRVINKASLLGSQKIEAPKVEKAERIPVEEAATEAKNLKEELTEQKPEKSEEGKSSKIKKSKVPTLEEFLKPSKNQLIGGVLKKVVGGKFGDVLEEHFKSKDINKEEESDKEETSGDTDQEKNQTKEKDSDKKNIKKKIPSLKEFLKPSKNQLMGSVLQKVVGGKFGSVLGEHFKSKDDIEEETAEASPAKDTTDDIARISENEDNQDQKLDMIIAKLDDIQQELAAEEEREEDKEKGSKIKEKNSKKKTKKKPDTDKVLGKLKESPKGETPSKLSNLGNLVEGAGEKLGGLAKGAGNLMKGAGAAVAEVALPALAVAGAAAAGYAAGSYINEKLGISDKIVDLISPDAEIKQTTGKEQRAGTNKKLEGTGYELVAPGKYKAPDGKIVSRDELPDEVNNKLGIGPKPAPKKEEKKSDAVTPGSAAVQTATVDAKQVQKDVSKKIAIDNRPDNTAQTPQTNQIVNQSPVMINVGDQSPKQPINVIVRNLEPTISTYNASIFDHPVVHPGIYQM